MIDLERILAYMITGAFMLLLGYNYGLMQVPEPEPCPIPTYTVGAVRPMPDAADGNSMFIVKCPKGVE